MLKRVCLEYAWVSEPGKTKLKTGGIYIAKLIAIIQVADLSVVALNKGS